MRLLLDTHAVVWAGLESHRLSAAARHALADPDNERLVSAVSAYEIEYKRSVDDELDRLPADLNDLRERLVFDWLPLEPSHAIHAGRWPRSHKDPWDRIIAAQAHLEGLTIVSIDPAMTRFGIPVLW